MIDIQFIQTHVLKCICNEGMLADLLNGDSITFLHLQLLDEEEARFDEDWLILSLKLVATVVELGDQVLHVVAVKGCHTDKHFVEHDTECPSVYHLAISALFQ